MKSHLRNHVAALFLLAPVAVTFSALPAAALAQSATPEVRALEVTSDAGIQPGSRLRFRMEGSPHAHAMVRIRGVESTIALREVDRGVYVGRYVITRNDRIEEGAPIRAILRNGNRTTSASYSVPEGLGNGNVANVEPPPQELRIQRFTAAPIDRAEPGTEMRFAVEGAPGARAYVDLPGIDANVPLREVRPGFYEGTYVLRRADRLNPTGPVVANLRWGDRIASTNLDHPLVAMASVNVPIEIISHPNNGTIEGDVALVRGRTAPFAQVQVRVNAVPPLVGQFGVAQEVFAQTVQANERGFFEFSFRSPFPVPGTKYDVSLVASKADVTREAHLVLYQRQG